MAQDTSGLWLVVEDQSDDFLLLERASLHVKPPPRLFWVKDGTEAQHYLAGIGQFSDRQVYPLPSLVLSDIKMPCMDGLELLAWFRSQAEMQNIPFVFLTCSSMVTDQQRAQELAVDGYLVKPTDSNTFVRDLQQIHLGLPPSLGSWQ